jgi:uncharacterized membrane protein required for colicin V production
VFDVFVLGIIILFGFNGYRRGWVKSLVSLVFLYLSFIAAIILYEWPSMYLQIMLGTSTPVSRVVCFSIFFIIFVVITRYIYYLIIRLNTQVLVRGVLSGIAGAALGTIEGILLIGIIFMNIAFYPLTYPLKDSTSFMVIKDIPVDIRDHSLWFLPSMQDSLEKREAKLKEREKNKRDIMKEYNTH